MSLGLRKFHSSFLVPRARLALSAKYTLNGRMPQRVSNPRYISMTATMMNDQEMKTVMNTYQKLLKVPDGAKVSRHDFVSFSKDFERACDKVEAFFINSVLMKFADLYGLDKFPEEGGKVCTLEEMYKALKKIPKETVDFHIKAIHRALFRATDTNNNGYISRDEWAVLLKIQNLYENDEHAHRSFDSLDVNKDGQISIEEFEKFGEKFWGNSLNEVSDLYGTSAGASTR